MRGSQSAAMQVVAAEEPDAWRREVDLRVEDHPEPLGELRRLLPLNEAYTLADRGDTLLGEKRFAEATAYYERASALAPANAELQFWLGLGMAQASDITGGADRVRRAIDSSPASPSSSTAYHPTSLPAPRPSGPPCAESPTDAVATARPAPSSDTSTPGSSGSARWR